MSIEGLDPHPNPRPNQDPTIISREEFKSAQRDPEVINFLEESREYGAELEAEGRIHHSPEQPEELSRFGRVRKFGSDLMKIMISGDKGDIARGMYDQF